jgi:tripartite-type tricarboxylate transporter receptor subunit TctC
MLTSRSLILAAGAVGMAISAFATPATAAFYEGKTITVIVGSSAGGGLSRSARTFMKHMENYIPGKPNVIIKNLPGAGGNVARNFMYNKAKKDGLTLHWGTLNQLGHVLKSKGIQFDPSKFLMIGAGDTTYFTLARTDTGKGLKTAPELMTAGGLIVGGRAPTSNLDIFTRGPLKILGLEHRYVPGYKGQAKMNPAIRAKEINLLTTGNGGYVGFYRDTILKNGEAVGLFYHSAINAKGEVSRKPGLYGDAVNFVDYVKSVTGKEPSGDAWEAYKWLATYSIWPFMLVAPPGVSGDAVAELRAAFDKTTADSKFTADYAKSVGAVPNYASGKDSEWLLRDYKNVSPAVLNGLKLITARVKKN